MLRYLNVIYSRLSEPCPIDICFNFARHTRRPYRKIESPIFHVWGLTNDQLISFASRTGKIYQTLFILFAASCLVADKIGEDAHKQSDANLLVGTKDNVL